MSSYMGTETRHALRLLRASLVVGGIPVKVVTVPATVLAKHHKVPVEHAPFGDCLRRSDHWRIRLQRGVEDLAMRDTLEHEYAHALDEFLNGPATEPHRKSWGACVALCHQEIYGKLHDAR